MSLQKYLVEKFQAWKPAEPAVLDRTKRDITLDWAELDPYQFLAGDFIYKVERYNKMPQWMVVYSGGKTRKTIDNLAPRHPHRFRLKVLLTVDAVPRLADKAMQYYGDEGAVYEKFGAGDVRDRLKEADEGKDKIQPGNGNTEAASITITVNGEHVFIEEIADSGDTQCSDNSKDKSSKRAWLESQWSDETWTSTDTDGTSAVCFSMAVRCGYIKQLQSMLDERPELVGVANPQNGFTPLATAVRRGDTNMVRYLLSQGADVDQPSAAGQAPLHLAIYAGNVPMAELLLERGANFEARDWNDLRVEHYAVDSTSLDAVKFVLGRGGDVNVEDNNGWTPLFRAVCQGASAALVEELVARGADVEARDRAGLPLACAARMIADTPGRSRDSILRLVDSSYPHEKALANFTRLTKKIYNVHSLFKLI